MKQSILINIPNPCHENWDRMTATEKGRFCGNCSKEVTDFSIMTDQQIFSHLSKSKERVCGHFSAGQLDRAITEPAKPIKKTFWAVLFSFILPFIVVNKTKAQQKIKPPVEQERATIGEVIATFKKDRQCDTDTSKTKLPSKKYTTNQFTRGELQVVKPANKKKLP